MEFKEIKTAKVVDYDDYVYDIELEENHYFSVNGIITHNCRLKNKLQTKEFSFTNGNLGVMTGSKSVITLNLSRIVQNALKNNTDDTNKMDCILSEIKEILSRVYKYHEAYNELLYDMNNAKLLPAYEAGFITLEKQYLTIGINGLNQAAEFIGLQCNDNQGYMDFCQQIFSLIKSENIAHRTDKMMFNTEQVPAESLAIKNYNWDKDDDYWVPEDTNLYASYIFKPNDKEISVLGKIRLHGKNYIGDYLDGGAACHINLEEHLNKEQYMKLLKYAGDNGCSYLTFNVPNSECSNCGYITKHKIDKCPKCGEEHIYIYDRIIGYLTKLESWSKGRRIEQQTRNYHSTIE